MEMLPITFSSFIGQEQIKIKLQVQIDATKKRRVPLDNFLLCGPDQMGKLTLAKTIAGEMGVTIRVLDSEVVSAKNTPILKLQEVLTHVRAGDLLVLERIDALKANSPAFSIFRDYLSANVIDVEVGKGVGKKKVKLNLPKISIIGLSAYPRRIDSKLREYFAIQYDLLPYTVAEISELIVTFVEELKQSIDVSAAQLIAAYCDGNPGKAKILSKRVADFALDRKSVV